MSPAAISRERGRRLRAGWRSLPEPTETGREEEGRDPVGPAHTHGASWTWPAHRYLVDGHQVTTGTRTRTSSLDTIATLAGTMNVNKTSNKPSRVVAKLIKSQ